MVHNNKILTVSYGTFSCTLEGFDDSFDTMKAIAEYFRDLASDDRYFGAEPPQPDADMLARIAQREISRQVEASSTDTGAIVLRAGTAAAGPTAVPIEPEPEVASEVTLAETEEPTSRLEAELTSEPTLVPDTAEVDQVEIAVEVTEEIVEEIAEEPDTAPVIIAPTLDHQPVEAETPVQETASDVTEILAEDVQDEPGDDAVENTVESAPIAAPVEAELIAEPVTIPPVQPAADSIAAKLQRIRAVVSNNEAMVQSEDYTEDQHAEALGVSAVQDITQSLEADAQDMDNLEEQDADDEILQVLDRLKSSDPNDMTDAVETTDSADIEEPHALDTELFDDLDDEDATEDLITDTTGDLTRDDLANILSDDSEDQIKAPTRAHVIKVKRADIAAELAAELTDEQLDRVDDENTDDLAATPENSLLDEDEADLQRELAAVEIELALGSSDDDDDDFFADHSETPEPTIASKEKVTENRILTQTVSEDEAALARLMAEADQKLEDPETSSNHETYSQLRAAAAVAQADKSAGKTVGEDTSDNAYRDDLASVVRPRRPSVGSNRAHRPVVEDRPAPLKLVAEQRVDDGASQARHGSVRPRRVSTLLVETTVPLGETNDGFTEFAAEMGATELPDLLEAAAAYLSFVEGREKFSRPQLMNKVRLIKKDEFNREDGLRSFGQLLRDGKIEKKGGGRFSASGSIGFRPEEREAS